MRRRARRWLSSPEFLRRARRVPPAAALNPHDFWQAIEPAGGDGAASPSGDAISADAAAYAARFDDGRTISLPIRPLPDGRHAVASLIITQASFAVVDALASDLAAKLRACAPEIVVGLPTLGLTLAAAVGQRLGHPRYVALGTSRKFWYDEHLSVPLASITSPDVRKRLYIDPRMVPLLAGRRVALVDDVISSGVSMAAAIDLLSRCGCAPVVLAAAMLQSQRWCEALTTIDAERVLTVLRTPLLERTPEGTWSEAR